MPAEASCITKHAHDLLHTTLTIRDSDETQSSNGISGY